MNTRVQLLKQALRKRSAAAKSFNAANAVYQAARRHANYEEMIDCALGSISSISDEIKADRLQVIADAEFKKLFEVRKNNRLLPIIFGRLKLA